MKINTNSVDLSLFREILFAWALGFFCIFLSLPEDNAICTTFFLVAVTLFLSSFLVQQLWDFFIESWPEFWKKVKKEEEPDDPTYTVGG